MREEDHQSATLRDDSRNHERHGRPVHWFTSAAFATIALVAILKETNGAVLDQRRRIKWVAIGISFALSLAILGVLATVMLRHKFVGTYLEGALALMTVGLWAALLPSLMNPTSNVTATGRYGEISNANLYFFSWGATITALLALARILQKYTKSPKKNHMFGSWSALTLTSIVVMMAASRIFQQLGCKNVESSLCNRTKFAIVLGAVSGLLAFIHICVSAFWSIKILDTILAWIFLTAWCFGISYITFGGDQAPAPGISNLYFFTWGSFALTVALAARSLYSMLDKFMGHNDRNVVEGGAIVKEKESHGPNQRRDLEAIEVRDPE